MEIPTGELLVRRIHVRKQLRNSVDRMISTGSIPREDIEHRMRLNLELAEIDKELKKRGGK